MRGSRRWPRRARAGEAALADDFGFCVAALGGAPGVHSARWAGPDKDFAPAMARVNRELGDQADRRAWFIAVLCLAWPDGHTETFLGRVDGAAIWPPRGELGFGYDPMFVPAGGDADLRRDGAGREARAEPPRARLRAASGGVLG